jgi:hypothetical protein
MRAECSSGADRRPRRCYEMIKKRLSRMCWSIYLSHYGYAQVGEKSGFV